jgi:hypothetical protein
LGADHLNQTIAVLNLPGKPAEQQDAFGYGVFQGSSTEGTVIAVADGHGVNGGTAAKLAVSWAVEGAVMEQRSRQ